MIIVKKTHGSQEVSWISGLLEEVFEFSNKFKFTDELTDEFTGKLTDEFTVDL